MDKDVDEDIIDVEITEEEEDFIEHVPQTETIHLIANVMEPTNIAVMDVAIYFIAQQFSFCTIMCCHGSRTNNLPSVHKGLHFYV